MALDGSLKERLKQQAAQESETLQAATEEQLNAMRSGLQSIYADALSTIEADMQSQRKALAKRMRSLILWPSLCLVMISLSISAGAWAFTHYQYQQIQEQRETLANLETLGVKPVRTDEGREYLKLPKGTSLSEIRQTREGLPYIEILRE